MKTIGVLLLLVLVGGAAWWFRDLLPFGGTGESVEISQEAAQSAEDKLVRMQEHDETARLSSAELTSLLRFRSPSWASNSVGDPEVRMRGDTLHLSGTIPTDRIPQHPDLDRVRGLLPDSAKVEVEGHMRTLDGGRAALELRQVSFAGIPIPERYYPTMLERLGRHDEVGLSPSEMALPLPPGVSDARIEGGYLILIP